MIYIGSDHGGYNLKEEIKNHLNSKNIDYVDCGTNSTDSVDYPTYGKKVCEEVLQNKNNIGILICGTGIGMSITANKYKGIRASLCSNVFSAEATKEHNDANVLVLGERVTGVSVALTIVDAFLNTPFSNDERHIRRINNIEQ